MYSVVIDENLPRRFGTIFAARKIKTFDIRDYGLRGKSDKAVFAFVKEQGAALATSDIGFAQWVHLFEKHRGIILVRLPSVLSLTTRCQELKRALGHIGDLELAGQIAVITPGALRLHGEIK